MKDALISVKPEDINQSPSEARRARISAEFRERPAKVHDQVGPARSMREHILQLSLFPNVYNARMLRTNG
jgi:hypothetical protein